LEIACLTLPLLPIDELATEPWLPGFETMTQLIDDLYKGALPASDISDYSNYGDT